MNKLRGEKKTKKYPQTKKGKWGRGRWKREKDKRRGWDKWRWKET